LVDGCIRDTGRYEASSMSGERRKTLLFDGQGKEHSVRSVDAEPWSGWLFEECCEAKSVETRDAERFDDRKQYEAFAAALAWPRAPSWSVVLRAARQAG